MVTCHSLGDGDVVDRGVARAGRLEVACDEHQVGVLERGGQQPAPVKGADVLTTLEGLVRVPPQMVAADARERRSG